jgi:lactoylglutathione lyase
MSLGLRPNVYHVKNINDAKKWCTDVLGKEHYFNQPYYAGYNLGEYELGLVTVCTESNPKLGGWVAYWCVKDAKKAFYKLIMSSIVAHEDIRM